MTATRRLTETGQLNINMGSEVGVIRSTRAVPNFNGPIVSEIGEILFPLIVDRGWRGNFLPLEHK